MPAAGRNRRVVVLAPMPLELDAIVAAFGLEPDGEPPSTRFTSGVGGSDVTLKKLYRENGKVRLQPANPTMQPIFVDPEQVQVQGVVVGMMRKY